MPIGAAAFFDPTDPQGSLTRDNLNSLEMGGNTYPTPGADLRINVTAFDYWDLATQADPIRRTFAGTSSVIVASSTTNFVFLDNTNALRVNAVGFPTTQDHIPLAEVITDLTGVTSVTDRRPVFILGQIPRLPGYAVASLPGVQVVDGVRQAFATDGRKSGEGGGSGTGVPVWFDGSDWRTFFDNSVALA